jgi:hypothetical protein
MSARISTRLPDDLHQYLVTTALARGVTPSDILRESLTRFLDGGGVNHSGQSQLSDTSVGVAHDLNDCALALMTKMPPEFQEIVLERARFLDLSVAKVVTALIIASAVPIRSV